ncbi:hypothetical protein JW960_13750 [candidate division KSB1 bacterium]|nr:hypothetical protein [candidate division KSB1 bacterium]
MSLSLLSEEIGSLIQSVFAPQAHEKKLAIIIDVPDDIIADNPFWQARRKMASEWCEMLRQPVNSTVLDKVEIFYYRNVHSNNADLPDSAYSYDQSSDTLDFKQLITYGTKRQMLEIMQQFPLFVALTELSATAPLKLAAPKYGFRAVTMPGFNQEMIPSLRLDYELVHKRIMTINKILDDAVEVDMEFQLKNGSIYNMIFDTRFRQATASSGRFTEPGKAGNLPGGECYIVPYEGELQELSATHGTLPVQFKDEVVLYEIVANKAIRVLSLGTKSKAEQDYINREPAYGNMAEIGFGILNDFGLKPTGHVLLDEKLGLHIAFGRSDHFGGAVGVKDFSSPEQVVHIDRIFIRETQPDIAVNYVIAKLADGDSITIIENDSYQIFG